MNFIGKKKSVKLHGLIGQATVNCLLEVAIALRQLKPIHKKGLSSF